MDSKQFSTYIEKPSKISFEEIKEWQKHATDYPFSQSLQILNLLYNSLKDKYEKEYFLQKAFLYTTNNIHLIDLKEILIECRDKKDTEIPEPLVEVSKKEIKKDKKKQLKDILAKRINKINKNDKSDASQDVKTLEKIQDPTKKEKPRIITKTDDEQKIRSQVEIIDKFIRDEPSMGPISKDDSKIDIEFVKRSTEPNNDIISETLANIYVSQGFNKRAKELFEKLSLKYPEKSSYFAAQIQNLKKKIKK